MFVESSVHQLESLLAAAQSMGLRGAMYIVAGALSRPPPVWFSPAVHSPTLGAYERAVALAVSFWVWSLMESGLRL